MLVPVHRLRPSAGAANSWPTAGTVPLSTMEHACASNCSVDVDGRPVPRVVNKWRWFGMAEQLVAGAVNCGVSASVLK